MFAARTESRHLFYIGKQVYIGDSHIMVVPTPRVTDPQNGPPRKNGKKSWGFTCEVGGSGPLFNPLPPSPPLPRPVVAPLASHEVRSELDILVVLYKSVCFVTVSIGEIGFSLLERLEAN